MLKQILSPLLALIISLCIPAVFAQSPAQAPATAAQSPTTQAAAAPPLPLSPTQSPPLVQSPPPSRKPSGPPNITAILEKAGHFNTFIRLLKSTQMDGQIHTKLNDSNQGLTVFAPTDPAFGELKAGALNSYSDQQKIQLVKFHLISSFLSIPAFQTVSNPMSTDAGSNAGYLMNVTLSGNNQLLNISTGIVNTTVSKTVYSDNQLAVYQVEKVLLPLSFFVTPSPSPLPKPKSSSSSSSSSSSKPESKKAPSPLGSSSTTDADADSTTKPSSSVQSSGAVGLVPYAVFGAMSFASFLVAILP